MKNFLSILIAAIMVVCIAVPAFADDTTNEYPNSFTSAQAEEGTHVLDGIVGEDEYDVKIERFHKDNEDYVYYHCVWFQPVHGKENIDSAVSNWYFGYDAENLYWAVEILDGKRAISEETNAPVEGASRVSVTFFVGDPADEYSHGVHAQRKTDGSISVTENSDGPKNHPDMGAGEYNADYVKYNEIVNEDETVTEVWEVKIPFQHLREFTGAPSLGDAESTKLCFYMFVESDNAYEEVCDRINIGANKDSDSPVVDSMSYFIVEVDRDPSYGGPANLFELTLDHICAYFFQEVEGGHQGVCTCGDKQDEVLDHDWDPGVINKDATVDEEGEILYTCYECSAEKTEVIPKLAADLSDDKEDDDKAGNAGDTVGATDDGSDDKSGGCGASISALGVAMVAILGLGVTAVSKKN